MADLKISALHLTRPAINEHPTAPYDSFFREALVDWTEMNLSLPFKSFQREIWELTYSLPLLLLNKERIVKALLTHIEKQDPLSLDALLDLVTKLAKDLQSEFYPYFVRIIESMLPLFAIQDTKILEATFTCLSFLFKYLSRLILPDIFQVYLLLAPALGSNPALLRKAPYVRSFAAESLSFLVHKLKDEQFEIFVAKVNEDLRQRRDEEEAKELAHGIVCLWTESLNV